MYLHTKVTATFHFKSGLIHCLATPTSLPSTLEPFIVYNFFQLFSCPSVKIYQDIKVHLCIYLYILVYTLQVQVCPSINHNKQVYINIYLYSTACLYKMSSNGVNRSVCPHPCQVGIGRPWPRHDACFKSPSLLAQGGSQEICACL